jgi:hypothetical protein
MLWLREEIRVLLEKREKKKERRERIEISFKKDLI